MGSFWDLVMSPWGKLVVGIGLMLLFIATGWWVLERLRDSTANNQPAASDLLTNLPQLRGEGAVSEEEYRTIKTAVEARLQQELSDTKNTG
jgi:hypothetical protein